MQVVLSLPLHLIASIPEDAWQSQAINLVELVINVQQFHPTPDLLNHARRIASSRKAIITIKGDEDANIEVVLAILSDFEDMLMDYIDLDYRFDDKDFKKVTSKFKSIKRITSLHLNTFNHDLHTLLHTTVLKRKSTHYKIAMRCESHYQALTLLAFQKDVNRSDLAVMGMGTAGQLTRHLANMVMPSLMYVGFDDEHLTAKGQLKLSEVDAVTNRQDFYALIGDPISKSYSHITHNSYFKKCHPECYYTKILLTETELEKGLYSLHMLGFKGLSVTAPHKIKVTAHPLVHHDKNQAAVNTLVYTSQGFKALNTDVTAFKALIKPFNNQPLKNFLILGTGAMAISLGKTILEGGGRVFVWGRSSDAVEKICECHHFDIFDQTCDWIDVVVQATSSPEIDIGDILPRSMLPVLGFEVIANPVDTVFVQMLAARGVNTIKGIDLFAMQAKEQFELFGFNDAALAYDVVVSKLRSTLAVKKKEQEAVWN